MIENIAMKTYEAPVRAEPDRGGYVFAKPLRTRRFPRRLNLPGALVVSSDEAVQQNLAEAVIQCGLIVFLAFTVGEGRRILNRQEISLVVCDDRVIDGKYEELVQAAKTSRTKPPVIVVSRVGDWPDYLKAVNGGAFDFLAYPPIRGELPRVVYNAISSRVLEGVDDVEVEHSEFLGGAKQ
jgi:DNA-binding NtrC family response regulator